MRGDGSVSGWRTDAKPGARRLVRERALDRDRRAGAWKEFEPGNGLQLRHERTSWKVSLQASGSDGSIRRRGAACPGDDVRDPYVHDRLAQRLIEAGRDPVRGCESVDDRIADRVGSWDLRPVGYCRVGRIGGRAGVLVGVLVAYCCQPSACASASRTACWSESWSESRRSVSSAYWSRRGRREAASGRRADGVSSVWACREDQTARWPADTGDCPLVDATRRSHGDEKVDPPQPGRLVHGA